ncbi:DNA recombination protein RmuC [Metamycoplasma gateae]|uniref:DNA recombination protein RmuC n=1 Tax=Metamycoplasma gateae TaxID=35769 RepID=A0ABZ2ANC6_9BACT|nr:DNA recombination protein RmuC [Metamycoplasma gateae]
MNKEAIILIVFSSLILVILLSLLIFIIIKKTTKNKDVLAQKDMLLAENEKNFFALKLDLENKLNKINDDLKYNIEIILNKKVDNLKEDLNNKVVNLNKFQQEMIKDNLTSILVNIKENNKIQNEDFNKLSSLVNENINKKLEDISKKNIEWFENIKKNIDEHFEDKLTKQIKEQFGNIKNSMDEMNKGMIQFSTIEKSVIDLNKTFSNSKNVGNFGEFTLLQIFQNHFPTLENKLWFQQYKIDPKTDEIVDFVIKSKMQIDNKEQEMIIPIDCKFPLETWNNYINQTDENAKTNSLKLLKYNVQKMAKSISEKYIRKDKKTTPYALMYLPSEYIYSTLINDYQFVSALFQNYKIILLGPTFVMAFIYSFFIQSQNYQVSKDIEKIKNLFIEVQRNYSYLNKNIVDGWSSINDAKESIEKAYGYSDKIINKINKNAQHLGVEQTKLTNSFLNKENKIKKLVDLEKSNENE